MRIVKAWMLQRYITLGFPSGTPHPFPRRGIFTAEQVVSLSTVMILPQGAGFKIVLHNHAGANNTGFANFDSFSYYRIAANKGTPLDRRPTIDYCRSRDVTVIFNHRIVLDECFRVNNSIIAHTCAAVHDGLMHDNRPSPRTAYLET